MEVNKIDNFQKIVKQVDVSGFAGKKILITGSNGLIGKYLASFFIFLNTNYGFNIDLYLTSKSKYSSSDHGTYISKDLAYEHWYWGELPKIDFCFYCAGYAQPSKFISDPITTLNINTVGVYNTFSSIFEKNTEASCLFLSSSEVYSNTIKSSPHEETDTITVDPTNKRNCYILGKLAGEHIVNSFRNNNKNVISARVSLCYGPGVMSDDKRALSEMVQKGVHNGSIDLFDDGSATRKYMHVSDFTTMILNVILKGKNNIYNICGSEESSIYKIATIVSKKLNVEVIKGHDNNVVSISAPKVVQNSLNRYNNEFTEIEFKPLEEGINEFVDWYVNELNKVNG